MTPEPTSGSFVGAAGGNIHWRRWDLADPTAQVVVVHGYGEHGGRYGRIAARLNATGIAVWVNDHRGHGQSEGARGMLTRLGDAVADVDQVVELARHRHPSAPVFVFGHSMGGPIALQHAIEHQAELAGLMLSAGAISLAGAGVSRTTQRILQVAGRVVPRLPVNRLPLDNITRDPVEARAYFDDPLIYRGAQPARTAAEIVAAMARLPGEVASLRVPLLLIHGGADRIVSADASRDIAERAGSRDKRLIVYDGFVHELLNEPEADRERVTEDLIAWIEARLAA